MNLWVDYPIRRRNVIIMQLTFLHFLLIQKAEGFGLTLAEAMYCNAVPVTYTIEGSGVNWVSLHEVTGLEVPNRNVAEYAKAIDELLSDDKKEMISRRRLINGLSKISPLRKKS